MGWINQFLPNDRALHNTLELRWMSLLTHRKVMQFCTEGTKRALWIRSVRKDKNIDDSKVSDRYLWTFLLLNFRWTPKVSSKFAENLSCPTRNPKKSSMDVQLFSSKPSKIHRYSNGMMTWANNKTSEDKDYDDYGWWVKRTTTDEIKFDFSLKANYISYGSFD